MESTRQLKITRLIQKELGDYFLRETRQSYKNAMITVTQVRVTKDLSIARIYLSLFATEDKESLMKLIQTNKNKIRHDLAQRIGKQVRIIPQLEFYLDDSLDYIEKIDQLLKK